MVDHRADRPCAAAEPGDSPGMPCPGDIAALIGRHYGEVYRYAYRLCGNPADAEDLTQQTFLVAHERLHQVRDTERAGGWLFTVLRNCFLRSRRRERPVAAVNLELDVESIPDGTPEAEVDGQRLQLALNELPDEFRLVVLMFYFEECSYKEIAERLDISMGTVMSRLSRAKAHLRKRLAEGGAKAESVRTAKKALGAR